MIDRDNPEYKEYFDKVDPDREITLEEYSEAINQAHRTRTTVCYLIWKKIKEFYPEIDADKIMIEAHREFGIKCGEKWGNINNAKESLLAQSSRAGYHAFKQELVEYTEDYAQKNFGYCPHVDALKKLGAGPEEIKFFCQEILSAGDYGNLEPHKNVRLEFKKQIGAGDDHCEYCVLRV